MTLADTDEFAPAGFSVNLANFEGPFDLLLQLISKHQLDTPEVANEPAKFLLPLTASRI